MRFHFIVLVLLFSISVFSQTEEEKLDFIIDKFGLVEDTRNKIGITFTDNISQIDTVTDKRIKINNLNFKETLNRLYNAEIRKRIRTAFNSHFTTQELDDLYRFTKSSVFDKVINYGNLYMVINEQFIDFTNDMDKLIDEAIKLSEPLPETDIENPNPEPYDYSSETNIPVNHENGFYEVIRYDDRNRNETELAEKPSITMEDIDTVLVEYKLDRDYLLIKLTANGRKKFFELTKKNVNKPIAIVIDKQIIAMPIVYEPIDNDSVNISGGLSKSKLIELKDSLLKSKNSKN